MTKTGIRDALLGSGRWNVAEHAHFYLWVTNNYLPKGLWLMHELGFRYVTNLCWAKGHFGIGQYFRGQHELLLFGVRGRGKDPSVFNTERRNLPTCPVGVDHVRGERGRRIHSAKPPKFHEIIEARTKGPRVEFFARGLGRPGWDTWGNESA